MGTSAYFDTLVAAYGHDLYRFAYSLCQDEYRAEDLVQETLLRSWRSVRQLRDAKSTLAWLLATLRREYHRRYCSTTEIVSLEDELWAGESDRFDVYPEIDATLDVEQRVSALPANYREVLVLQLLFGYSTREIASLLDTTEAAVANRLLRARRSLRMGIASTARSRRRA